LTKQKEVKKGGSFQKKKSFQRKESALKGKSEQSIKMDRTHIDSRGDFPPQKEEKGGGGIEAGGEGEGRIYLKKEVNSFPSRSEKEPYIHNSGRRMGDLGSEN